MLHHQGWVVAGQIVGGLDGDLVQHERADDRVDDADAELVEVLRAELLRDAQEPLDVLAVRRVACVLRLRPIVVDAAR